MRFSRRPLSDPLTPAPLPQRGEGKIALYLRAARLLKAGADLSLQVCASCGAIFHPWRRPETKGLHQAESLRWCTPKPRLDSYPFPRWGRGMGVRGLARRHLLSLAALVLLPCSALAVQPKTTLEKVGNQVYCQCGCVTTVNRCPHLPSECESRAELTASILKDIRQGEDQPAILQDLSRQYGVQVLAAPPTKGFDLAAWVLPGFGLVIGLIVVLLIVRHLRRKAPPEPPADALAADANVLAAVEEEIKAESRN